MPVSALKEKLEFFVKIPNVSRLGCFCSKKRFFRVHSSISI